MQLIRGLHNLRPEHRGCVATIGNFDGVHLGHQLVLGQLADKASNLDCPSTVITFEPQPLEYFAGDAAPARLMRLREKLTALRRYAVDRVLCLAFNKALAEMPYQDFIRQILVDGLGVKYLVVGDDFQFGKNRTGSFQDLCDAGAAHGFEVVNMHSFSEADERVSSTGIRKALGEGDMHKVEQLLGRSYRMSGRVAHGEKLGRQLGYPTANIHIHRKVTPLQGIFVVEVFDLPGEPLQGVASIGTRPVVKGKKVILEVYLFDFDQDIYGKCIEVSFLHKLRDEQNFDTLEALTEQIAQDVEQARAYFRNMQ